MNPFFRVVVFIIALVAISLFLVPLLMKIATWGIFLSILAYGGAIWWLLNGL